MSSLINKAREKIEATLDKSSNQSNNPHSTNAGPHSSNLVNKADPYVDSDRDHRNDPTSRVGGVGSTQEYNAVHGQSTAPSGVGGVDSGYGYNAGHTTGHTGGLAGGLASGHTTGHTVGHSDHNSGFTGHGVGHSGPTGGLTGHSTGHNVPGVGHTGTTGGYGGSSNTYDNPQSTNTGPHSSNLLNKLDPRTDSDNDNRNNPTSRVGGYGSQTDSYGHNAGLASGTHAHNTTTHGGYGSGTGNTASYGQGATSGVTGTHGHSSATPGTGNATNTAGPHNSNLLNKLDPRVDADLDGSKTYGGNATYR